MQYTTSNKNLSQYSPFRLVVVLVNPNLLGTHERVKKTNYSRIGLDKGWNGPPIAVCGFRSDSLYHRPHSELAELVNLDYGDLGVLDGHNRLFVSKKLGLTRVPVQIFPYRDKKIIVDTWLPNFRPLAKTQVTKYFKTRTSFAPPKATKHLVVFSKRLVPLKYIQASYKIGVNNLRI